MPEPNLSRAVPFGILPALWIQARKVGVTLAHYEIRILASSGSIALLIAHNAISRTFPLFEAREEKEKEENEREREKKQLWDSAFTWFCPCIC